MWSTKVVDGQLVDYTYDGRARRGWMRNAQVYYTLVDCNPLIPLLRSVLDLSYKLFIHCCAAVGTVLTDTSRRAVHLKSFLLHPLLHTMSRIETAETSIVRTKGKYIIDKYTYVSTWRTSYLLDFSPGLIRPLLVKLVWIGFPFISVPHAALLSAVHWGINPSRLTKFYNRSS